MAKSFSVARREFLQKSAIGGAGLTLTGLGLNPVLAAGSAYTDRKAINPQIDNMRVVWCEDPDMVSGNPSSWTDRVKQNAPVDVAKVHANMDEMAKGLAQTSTAEQAWAKIFQEPSKGYSQSKVAFKINCKPHNVPRVAVIDKVCRELNRLGVPYGNMILFDVDSDQGEDASANYSQFVGNGLPAGVVVSKSDQSLGGMTGASVPAPRAGTFNCPRDIANGTIDIIVNIAVNKGHDQNKGGLTCTLKNHLGTFVPTPAHSGNGLDYIIAVNKSDAIVGGSPVRQQLCIIDTIWAMRGGPSGSPDVRIDKLVMGTFGPAVDYLVAKNIREVAPMSRSHTGLSRFCTDFGYDENEPQWVEVLPGGATSNGGPAGRDTEPSRLLSLRINSPSARSYEVVFSHPASLSTARIDIRDMTGRLLRSLPRHNRPVVVWDGRSDSGTMAGPGLYTASMVSGEGIVTRKVRLIR